MTKKTETIFALDSSLTRGMSLAFKGVSGITSAFFGNTDVVKKGEFVGQIWDKLNDTVETTTNTSSQSDERT